MDQIMDWFWFAISKKNSTYASHLIYNSWTFIVINWSKRRPQPSGNDVLTYSYSLTHLENTYLLTHIRSLTLQINFGVIYKRPDHNMVSVSHDFVLLFCIVMFQLTILINIFEAKATHTYGKSNSWQLLIACFPIIMIANCWANSIRQLLAWHWNHRSTM